MVSRARVVHIRDTVQGSIRMRREGLVTWPHVVLCAVCGVSIVVASLMQTESAGNLGTDDGSKREGLTVALHARHAIDDVFRMLSHGLLLKSRPYNFAR